MCNVLTSCGQRVQIEGVCRFTGELECVGTNVPPPGAVSFLCPPLMAPVRRLEVNQEGRGLQVLPPTAPMAIELEIGVQGSTFFCSSQGTYQALAASSSCTGPNGAIYNATATAPGFPPPSDSSSSSSSSKKSGRGGMKKKSSSSSRRLLNEKIKNSRTLRMGMMMSSSSSSSEDVMAPAPAPAPICMVSMSTGATT